MKMGSFFSKIPYFLLKIFNNREINPFRRGAESDQDEIRKRQRDREKKRTTQRRGSQKKNVLTGGAVTVFPSDAESKYGQRTSLNLNDKVKVPSEVVVEHYLILFCR